MAVGLDHPAVAAYLGRFEAAAAAGLPPGRRDELVAEIRAHLQEALSGGAGDEVAVLQALDRLGAPEEIVAAEREVEGEGPFGGPATASATAPATGTAGPQVDTSWTPLEVVAVLLLIVGGFVLPLIGPLIGLVLVWVSRRWALHEKVIATVLMIGLSLLTLALTITLTLLAGATTIERTSSDQTGVIMPVPVTSSAPLPSLP